MDARTRHLIARQARSGRVAAALMLETFAQLDARGVPLEVAVNLAVMAAVRSELPEREEYPLERPLLGESGRWYGARK